MDWENSFFIRGLASRVGPREFRVRCFLGKRVNAAFLVVPMHMIVNPISFCRLALSPIALRNSHLLPRFLCTLWNLPQQLSSRDPPAVEEWIVRYHRIEALQMTYQTFRRRI